MALLLASLVFFALRLLPGDPAQLILGDEASPAELARVRATLHLDPNHYRVQYLRFLRGLATLDLGDSLRQPGTPRDDPRRRGLRADRGARGHRGRPRHRRRPRRGRAREGPWLGGLTRWVERALIAAAAAPLVAFAPVLTWVLAVRSNT